MRAVILGLAGLVIAGEASAADYLRGSSYESSAPSSGYNWAGVYIGGHAGYANANFSMSNAVSSLVADILRQTTIEEEANVSEWPSLPGRDARSNVFGGFIGYNSQWGDVVLGLELTYNKSSLFTASNDTISRAYTTSDDFLYDVTVSGDASAHITDYGTLRLRAGYAMGWLMPYMTGGVAVGRANVTRMASVSLTATDVSPSALDLLDGIDPRPGGSLNETRSEAKNGAIMWGYMGGLGIDIGLLPNVFIRGEWEFVQFFDVYGINMQINTFRAGAGIKF